MRIDEAVIKSIAEGKYIYRKKQGFVQINILPTNTSDCCILLTEQSDRVGKRWNPTANDLIANDWEIR